MQSEVEKLEAERTELRESVEKLRAERGPLTEEPESPSANGDASPATVAGDDDEGPTDDSEQAPGEADQTAPPA